MKNLLFLTLLAVPLIASEKDMSFEQRWADRKRIEREGTEMFKLKQIEWAAKEAEDKKKNISTFDKVFNTAAVIVGIPVAIAFQYMTNKPSCNFPKNGAGL